VADKRQGKSLKVLTWVAAGGSEGERSKMEEVKKKYGEREDKEGVMVVGREKMNKESASGTVGFEPQAQSVEVCSRCLGPILGSTRDPALHNHVH